MRQIVSLNAKWAFSKEASAVPANLPDKCIAILGPVLGPASRPETLKMLDAMTVLRMINVITGMMRVPVTKEQLLTLNAKLNQIILL